MSYFLMVLVALSLSSTVGAAASDWQELGTPEIEGLDAPPPQAREPAGGSDKKSKMLSGSVTHHQKTLPQVDPQFRVGATFDQNELLPNSSENWYWIPKWLAGKWERTEEKVLYRFDYLTHQETHNPTSINLVEHAEFGVQTDRSGGIWHCRLADLGIADRGSYMTVAIVKEQQPVVVSPAMVVVRDRFIQMDVNKETNAIMRVFQSESITRHTQVELNLIKTEASVKYFDDNGQPTSMQRNLSFDRRIGSFSPLDKYHGKDLKSSFRTFLSAHDMHDLVPSVDQQANR